MRIVKKQVTNKCLVFGIFVFILFVWNAVNAQQLPVSSCNTSQSSDSSFSKSDKIKPLLQKLTETGIPGAVIAVYSDEGLWQEAKGFVQIETRKPMRTCHLQYLQSISKMYMATAILILKEQGKIKLDEPITRYLPENISNMVTSAGSITVRMLLNHTSGVPEYNSVPAYVTRLLQRPNYPFKPMDYLQYIKGKSLSFDPGSNYSYRNTNYVLLALIVDEITGDHAAFINEQIFKPLELNNTLYRNDPQYLDYNRLANSYWDRYSNGIVENISLLQRNNVSSLIGDDGIVATPADALFFLKGLVESKLIAESSLAQMKNWVVDKTGKERYGLGLDLTEMGGYTAYGHSGGGIGSGSQLYFFPKKNVYMLIVINLGTVTDSPIHDDAMEVIKEIHRALLN